MKQQIAVSYALWKLNKDEARQITGEQVREWGSLLLVRRLRRQVDWRESKTICCWKRERQNPRVISHGASALKNRRGDFFERRDQFLAGMIANDTSCSGFIGDSLINPASRTTLTQSASPSDLHRNGPTGRLDFEQ